MVKRGAFRPGEALPIRALAERFGVSPTPVREALQQLVAEGAVVAAPNRSFRIAEIGYQQFVELREVRVLLERLAVERATARMTPPVLAELRHHNAAMMRAVREDRGEDFLSHNVAFHAVLYHAAGSAILTQILDMLWVRLGPYLTALARSRPLDEMVNTYHDEVIAAFAARDPAAATAAIAADIGGVADAFLLVHWPAEQHAAAARGAVIRDARDDV